MISLLQHPNLGQIKGIQHDGVAEYCGIKYADLASAFAEAQLHQRSSHENDTPLNATKRGSDQNFYLYTLCVTNKI